MMRRRLIHQRSTIAMQAILVVGVLGAAFTGQWFTAFVTACIVLLTLVPSLLEHRFKVYIPPELELLAIGFVFASLFLGEIRGYYARFWWWDVALHMFSGFLLGIIGFLLVHLLNEIDEIEVHLKPSFVALFAFLFAVGMGAIWEIFEFSMDRIFGLNMQKPMFNDPSGLTDTMWDLIVDSAGALVIAGLGYGYLRTARNDSFLVRWIDSFIEHNPRFFKNLK